MYHVHLYLYSVIHLKVDSETEEPIIFHRNLKSVVIEEDKDLDTSLSGESLLDLSFTQNEKKSFSGKF